MSHRLFRLFGLVVFCAVGLAPAEVPAAEFLVTSRLDSGAGTFRQALIGANAAANAPHVIRFVEPYPLGGRIVLASGLQEITVPVTIDGGNRAPQLSGNELFPLLIARSHLTVRNLFLLDGWTPAVNTTAGSGGCIRLTGTAQSAFDLTVENSRFENCIAQGTTYGGGGAIRWLSSGGSVTLRQSIFTGNFVVTTNTLDEQPRGGAVEIGAQVLIEDSTFENNQIVSIGTNGGFGGAVAIFQPNGASATLRGNRFRFNQGSPDDTTFGYGGAVHVLGAPGSSVVVENNWFRTNRARRGGALDILMVESAASSTLRNNSFQENDAQDGGQVSVTGGQLFFQHNTLHEGIASVGAHVRFTGLDARQFSNNLLTGFIGTSACSLVGVTRTQLIGAGNVVREACTGIELADDRFLDTSPIGERDESVRIGVLRFQNDVRILDRGNSDPEHCLPTDARGTARSADGNGDGTTQCDPGALEHGSPILFRSGFESTGTP